MFFNYVKVELSSFKVYLEGDVYLSFILSNLTPALELGLISFLFVNKVRCFVFFISNPVFSFD